MTQEEKVIKMAESMLKAILEREIEEHSKLVTNDRKWIHIQSVELSYPAVYIKITGENGEGSISFRFRVDDAHGENAITDIVLSDPNRETINVLHIIRVYDVFRRMCKLALDVIWEIQK